MNALSLALLGVVFGCAACSQKSAKELGDAGALALGRSDYPTAIENFHDAAERAAPGSDEFVAFKISECEAWCGINGERAAEKLAELAQDHSAKIRLDDYVSILQKLSSSRQFEGATAALEVARKNFPGTAQLDEFGQSLAKAAASSGNDASIEELAKMGYLSK